MRNDSWILALLVICGAFGCQGSGAAKTDPFDQTHGVYDTLLRRHVSNGLVDYQALLGEREALHGYLGRLGEVDPKAFNAFGEAERLAFLINAYNAATLDLILRYYPIASIQEIPNAWDAFQWPLPGGSFTLNQIEHELIRKKFKEPRIHFVLVCAAVGCPPLIARAYRPDSLEQQLASASRSYLADRRRNRLDRDAATLYISKIFEWYGEDFIPAWGTTMVPEGSEDTPIHRALIGFFIEYLPKPDAEFLKSHPVRIEFLDYDWTLNEAK